MLGSIFLWISNLLSRLKPSGTSAPSSEPSPSLPSSSDNESFTPKSRIVSESGLILIKHFEGLRLTAYLDSAGVPTIGYGHTRGVGMGDRISEDQAGLFLFDDVQDAVAGVRNLVKVPVTQAQFDALVSFVFNLGAGNFSASTLLRKLNLADYLGAADEFTRWHFAAGVSLTGLRRRRAAERALFLGADVTTAIKIGDATS